MPTARLALVCAVAALAGCASSLTPNKFVKFPESHYRLTNGLTVVVLPDPSTPLVEVDVRYDVGSRDDPAGKEGLAHLVEHLMFEQRQAGPQAPPIAAVFRERTVAYNAYTVWDSTHYESLAPAA